MQAKEVAEGAVVGALEHDLIAVVAGQGGTEAQVGPSAAEALVTLGVFHGDGTVEMLAFDEEGAAEAPVADGHFLDVGFFDGVAGVEFGEEIVHDDVEVLFGFHPGDDEFGKESVFGGVGGGALFPFLGFGAPGEGAVASGCFHASLRAHDFLRAPTTIIGPASGGLTGSG